MSMDYTLGAAQVIAEHYGTEHPTVTYEPAIEVPNNAELERLKSVKTLGNEREIALILSDHSDSDPNGWMHHYGLWPMNKNMVREITIKTTSTLSLSDYTKLMAAAFSEKDMKVHNAVEVSR